jgi:serine carboxypeptidase-like clade 2
MICVELLGHYVPQLSELIYKENKIASKKDFINLKGLMVRDFLKSIQ